MCESPTPLPSGSTASKGRTTHRGSWGALGLSQAPFGGHDMVWGLLLRHLECQRGRKRLSSSLEPVQKARGGKAQASFFGRAGILTPNACLPPPRRRDPSEVRDPQGQVLKLPSHLALVPVPPSRKRPSELKGPPAPTLMQMELFRSEMRKGWQAWPGVGLGVSALLEDYSKGPPQGLS